MISNPNNHIAASFRSSGDTCRYLSVVARLEWTRSVFITFPIHSKVLELLELYLNQRVPLSERALIIGEMGKKMTVTSFTNLVNIHLTISGLKKKGYTAHSFRHSFTTRLTEKNVNIFLVQRLLGHLSLDSTKIYVHFESNSYRNAIDYI